MTKETLEGLGRRVTCSPETWREQRVGGVVRQEGQGLGDGLNAGRGFVSQKKAGARLPRTEAQGRSV